MGIRKRSLLLAGATTILMTAVLHLIAGFSVESSVTKIEDQQMHAHLDRIALALENDIENLEATTMDWAAWDDTYEFILTGDPAYVESNLVDGTFEALDLGFMLLVDSSANLVYGKEVDRETKAEIPLSPSAASLLSDATMLSVTDQSSAPSGIVLLPEGMALLSVQPVLTSLDEGPARGVLIMGRRLTESELDDLRRRTALEFTLWPFDASELPETLATLQDDLLDAGSTALSRPDRETMTGIRLLEDIHGDPTMLVELTTRRDMYVVARQGLLMALAAIMLITGFIFVAIWSYLNRHLLLPITRITSEIAQIAEKSAFHERVTLVSKDELATLSRQTNYLLTSLETSHRQVAESEAAYRAVIDAAHDLIVSIRPDDGGIILANAAWKTTMGYADSELSTLKLRDIVDSASLPACQDAIQRVLAGEEIDNHVCKLTSKSGEWVYVEGRLLGRFVDGQCLAIQAFFSDISIQKQIEKERSLLAKAIDQASDLIMITDRRATIEYVNSTFEQVTGYASAQLVGQTPRLIFRQASNSERDESLHGALAESQPWHGRLPICRVDGTCIEAELAVSPVRDASGDVTHFVVLGRDITQQLALESKLQMAQKMEAVGHLAGGIAHDFNNLLTGVLGHASMLKMSVQRGGEIYEGLDIIEKAASHASELTQQLLGFARGGKLRDTPVDLHDTIHDVVSLLRRTIDKNIAITQRAQAKTAVILGDPGQIQQVILNLGINSRDAMPDGGELIFETEVVDISEDYCQYHNYARAGRYVMLSVTDSGHGIPKEIQGRVFEPFFTTKDQGKGSGMGLAMAYGIVKNHGGHINIYSEVGVGTCVKCYFPWAAGMNATRDSTTETSPVRGSGHILVVDDEGVVRDIASRMLEGLGYHAVTASDGQEAIDYYRQHGDGIDLVIIDMIMPRMGGHECYRMLKQIDPHVRAILSTGYGLNGAAQAMLDDGVLQLIQKPYIMAQLAETVAHALGEPARDAQKNISS